MLGETGINTGVCVQAHTHKQTHTKYSLGLYVASYLTCCVTWVVFFCCLNVSHKAKKYICEKDKEKTVYLLHYLLKHFHWGNDVNLHLNLWILFHDINKMLDHTQKCMRQETKVSEILWRTNRPWQCAEMMYWCQRSTSESGFGLGRQRKGPRRPDIHTHPSVRTLAL